MWGHSSCVKLSGYDGLHRIRTGDHRVIYFVSDRLVLVLVLKIGNRAGVYERIRKADIDYVRGILAKLEPPPGPD